MIDYILSSAGDLFAAIPHTSLQGRMGMAIVGVYFAVIVCTALYRIVKGEHMGH